MSSSGRRKKSFKRILKHKAFRMRNIFSILCLVLYLIFMYFLINLKILPGFYVFILGFVLLIINISSILFINAHRKKYLKVMGGIIMGVCFIFDLVGLYYIVNTSNYLDEKFSQANSYYKNTYYVLSLKDNYYSENDVDGFIGTYQETANLTEAMKKLSSKFSIKEKAYTDLEVLFSDLTNRTISFILVDSATYEIFFSLNNVYHKADYSIVYDFDVFTKREEVDSELKDSYQLLIGGKDTFGIMDFNVLLSIDYKTKEILITNIPNYYYFEVDNKQGRKDILQYMSLYGEETERKSIENLLDTTIDYSLIFDSKSLVSLVDYLGGITYCSNYKFTTTHSLSVNTFEDGKKF